MGDGGEQLTKHKGRNYEGNSTGETGGYTADKGLQGQGNIANPQALTEGDAVTKPGDKESGLSFKDLTDGGNGGGLKDSVKGLTGGGDGKGVVDSVKDLTSGGDEGQSFKDLAGGGQQGQSVKDLSGDKWGGE